MLHHNFPLLTTFIMARAVGLSVLMLLVLFAAHVHAHEDHGDSTSSQLGEHDVKHGGMSFDEGGSSGRPTCTCTCYPGAAPKTPTPPASQNSPTGRKRSPPPAPYSYSPSPVYNTPSPPPRSTQSPVTFASPPPPAPYSDAPTDEPAPVVAAPETFRPPPPIY